MDLTVRDGESALITSETRLFRARDKDEFLQVRSAGYTRVRILEKTQTRWRVGLTSHFGGGHCYPGPIGLSKVELILWVKSQDLVDVLTQDLDLSFEDGGSLALMAGLPVKGSVVMSRLFPPMNLKGREFPTAKTYVLGRGKPKQTKAGGGWANLRQGLRLGDVVIGQDTDVRFPSGSQGVALTPILAKCIRAKGHLVAGLGRSEWSGTLSILPKTVPPMARKGATIYWRDGSVAGRLRGNVQLPPKKQRLEVAGKVCFPVGEQDVLKVTLCVDIQSVDESTEPPAQATK